MPKEEISREELEEKEINTILADDIGFKGVLNFNTSLKIKGKFDGEISSEGLLVIGRTASFKGNISANQIKIYGKVTGNITAKGEIELFENAELIGDIITPAIEIEKGCKFNGNCLMEKPKNQEKKEEEPEKK